VEPSTEAKPKTVKLTINDKAVEVPAGTSVIQAAEEVGVFIPRYCYHPDLSIAGVCRMCMCDVEKNPKLQIACNTTVAEGMVIKTDTPRVKEAVKSALELHLINHPLDCPICDKAGECKLQDFYSDFGLYESRMDFDAKNHKPKVQDIGTIVLDSERCILCTRCVRFTAEVTKTFELGIFNRGDRSELRTYDHGPLKNDYTGNLADICPVGALTAKDFRFQQRVWFLDKTPSVCTLCAHGCNTLVSVNPNTRKLYRVEPRRNTDVNDSWICDVGRWGYHYVSSESRLKTPRQRTESGWVDSSWEFAFQDLHTALANAGGKAVVGLSTQLTNEEIADTVVTLKELGVSRFTWIVDESVVDDKKPHDGILKHRDLTPNAEGFKTVMNTLGVKWLKHADVTALWQKGDGDVFLALGIEGDQPAWVAKLLSAVPKSVRLFVHATNESPMLAAAEWVLPNVSAYEKTGTVINALGRLQKLNAALPPQYTARTAHGLVFGAHKGNDRELLPTGKAQTVFEEHLAQKMVASGTRFRNVSPLGVPLKEVPAHV
jgi:NADH-quinone oxidoreductase subunit G